MPNDIYQLKMFFSAPNGERAENVLNYQSAGTPSGGDAYSVAQDLITAFDSAGLANLLTCLSHDTTLSAYSCKKINNGGGPTSTRVSNQVGTDTPNTGSNANAVNICLLPASTPFQRKEGHIYLSGFFKGQLTDEVIQSALVTNVANWVNSVLNLPVTDGVAWNLAILDRTTKVATNVSDFIVRTKITPMRRRLKPRIA